MKGVLVENTFTHHKSDTTIINNRINVISTCINEINDYYVFQDGLNFNFLFCLYSQKLQSLINKIDNISEYEFQNKIKVLKKSINEITQYAIQ